MARRKSSARESSPRQRAPRAKVGGTALRAHLVASRHGQDVGRNWPDDVFAVIDSSGPDDPCAQGSTPAGWRPTRVHGGPGTGKTSLIVDAAVTRLTTPGIDPESVLILAASRRAATDLREAITRRVLAAGVPAGAGSQHSRLGGGQHSGALREPLVRTIHSYAFAILRLQASSHGNPPPRLITGSEQDVVLRELLAGDIDDGADYWPPHLRPALGTDGFAQALRDLMMRAAERGVGPEELAALGRRHRKPEWQAAARAYAQYEQNMLLRGAVGLETPGASAPAVDAAELVGSALSAFATDRDLLAAERLRIRHLLVDDAQHLDPQAAELIRLIGTGTTSTIIAADTDQSIFGFRGASPRFTDGLAEPGTPRDVVLATDLRSHPEINRVGAALAARLPGARPHTYPTPRSRLVTDGDLGSGGAQVRVFSSTAKEATAVADLFRRAHLFEGVPWSQMAVVVRSVARTLPALRRAFRSAGVPVTSPTSDLPLHRQRAVAAFMVALRAAAARDAPLHMGEAIHGVVGTDSFTVDDVVALLSGPVGGADPGAMRRLRRGIRRADEVHGAAGLTPDEESENRAPQPDSLTSLRRAVLDPTVAERYVAALSETESAPLRRVLSVLAAAGRAHDGRRGIEETLWAAWQASGLERRWAATALRGGPAGEQADRDLDSMMAMFEAAADFVDTMPAAGPAGFVHYLGQLHIPRDSRTPTAAADAVTVLSAHAAAGREWEVVAVAGIQDGLWPSLRSRGSVLSTPALVDLLDGVDPNALDHISRGASALADERRLLLVAATRARRRLLLTAVDDGGGDAAPSRFVAEVAAALSRDLEVEIGVDTLAEESAELPLDPGVERVLSLPSLVATLRAAVVAGSVNPGGHDGRTTSDERAMAAAKLLAELADSDVPGAHPRQWYGLNGTSGDEPLWTPERGPIVLSPSNIEPLTRCSLRWVLERNGGRDGDGAPALTGSLIHALVQAVAGQIDPAEVSGALRDVWERVDTGAAWYSARELERAEGMLTHFRDWLRLSRDDLREIGVELPIDAIIPAGEDPETEPAVRLRGRVDRLEVDDQGRPVVVDVKTAKTAVSQNDAEEHAQLAAYQVALAHGGAPGASEIASTEPGGGRLVYVASPHRTTGAAERIQPGLTPAMIDEWITVVRRAARASVGPQFPATLNVGCSHCALSTSCPAQLRGRAVTDD